MERLPLIVLEPAQAAILPGERRRVAIASERMEAGLALASSSGGRVAVLAFDQGQRREDELPDPARDKMLSVATACRLLHQEEGLAVLRGESRLEILAVSSRGGCCGEEGDPFAEGIEAQVEAIPAAPEEEAFARVAALLAELDLLPSLREESLDRLARWLALPAWVQGELLVAREPAARARLLAAAAQEMAAPGSSFRPFDLDAPYRDEADYLDDLVRDYEWRARAQQAGGVQEEDRPEALCRDEEIRRRRRAAALRVRAVAARRSRRLQATATLPALERLRREHGLAQADLDALLLAGLGESERFAARLKQASRLLPPGEMPLAAWIAALEAEAFAAVARA